MLNLFQHPDSSRHPGDGPDLSEQARDFWSRD
jgi:hypothetical protein